jgi:hypothetical protein
VHGPHVPFVPEPAIHLPPVPEAVAVRDELVALARLERPAEGVLTLAGVRCDARTATDARPGVRAGTIRTRAGRPVRGPSQLLDEPTRRLPRAALGDGRRRIGIYGRVAVLDLRGRSAENYFHWLVDALANRWLFRQAGFDEDAVDAYLMPSAGAPWQRESLELAGIDAARVVSLADVDRVDADEFVLPVRTFGSRRVPAWIVQALRDARPPEKAWVDGTGRRLYVSRGVTSRRRLANEADVVAHLSRRDFEVVTMDGLSVREQRALFASAAVVVAPHGAALTNLVWAAPGCSVIELVPLARPNLAFFHLAVQAGAVHHTLVCAPDPAGGPSHDAHGDMIADVDLLAAVVDRSITTT